MAGLSFRMDEVLGIDLGTSSAKAAIYNSQGDLLAAAESAYPTTYGHPGQVEQNPADWIAAVRETLKALSQALPSGRIQAIGLSAHAPAIAPTDEQGSPLLTSVPIWNDLRCIENGQSLARLVGEEQLWTGPGTALAAYYPQLHWLANHHPDVIQKAHWLLGPKDVIGHWLTGEAKSDPSSGAGAGHWRKDLLEACKVPEGKLPSLMKPTEVTGTLQERVAKELSMQPGIPVITGLNDGAAASIAANALQVGDVIITLGTNGVVRMVASNPASGPSRLRTGVFCWPYVDERWIVGGHTRIGASALGWLASVIGEKESRVEDIVELAAAAPPGANGLLFLPYMLGRGTPHNDDRASGTLHGLTLSSNRQDISRALLEGLTWALNDVLHSLPIAAPPRKIHLTGGGARSPIWTQIVADLCNVSVAVYSAQPALGAAILAAVGVGAYPRVEKAAEAMAHLNRQQEPNAENHVIYQRVQQRFQTLLKKM